MSPRGRGRKVGWRREDAALDAMKPFGFPIDLVKRKLKELLNTYGDDGWIFIEEASYKLLIEVILEEIQNEEHGGSPIKETVVGDHAQFAGGEQRIKGNIVPGVTTLSGTGQANATVKTVSPEAVDAPGVDKPDEGNGSISLAAHNISNHIETNVKSSELQGSQFSDQPVKRTRKTAYGWYDGSEDNDVIDVSRITSYKLTDELSGGSGTKNATGRKCRSKGNCEIGCGQCGVSPFDTNSR